MPEWCRRRVGNRIRGDRVASAHPKLERHLCEAAFGLELAFCGGRSPLAANQAGHRMKRLSGPPAALLDSVQSTVIGRVAQWDRASAF